MNQRRQPPVNPVILLVGLALVPAAALFGVFRWADGKASASADAVPPPDPAAVAPPAPQPALSTGLLSFRRTAGELSRALNLAAFEGAVQPLLNAVNDRSCAAVSLDGRLVGERNLATVVIPASNQKVLVAAVAAEVLGEDFTYTTRLVGPAATGGVIAGDVYLVGGGDPLLSGEWYETANLDRFGAFNTTPIDELARQLAGAGVTRIEGTLRGDGSRYDDEMYAPGWSEGVAGIEAGPYDALLVNDARVRNEEQRASDPNLAGVRELVRIMGEHGITVTGGAGTGTAPPGATELASVSSQPLPALLEEMLTNSDNNTAELMVKEIGLSESGSGTRQAGLDAIARTIQGWGIDTTGLVLGDGSGLSLENRISCATLLGVLQHVGYESPVGHGLAIAGETGTLRESFVDTPLAGRLRGKTGSLNNVPYDQDPPAVKTLAGFLPVDGDGAIEYVLLLNGPMIVDQSEYRPVWAELVTSLNSFPAVAGPAVLGPR